MQFSQQLGNNLITSQKYCYRTMQVQSSKNFRPQLKQSAIHWADGSRTASRSEEPEERPEFTDKTMIGLGAGVAANVAAAGYPSTWLHEMGHAKMIGLMYDGASPTVEVFPFKGGVTKWRLAPLSDVGQKFGPNGARAMVSAAGTLVDMGVATTTFGVGYKIRKEHPILGTALMGYAGATVANSIAYAATAVGKDVAKLAMEGNDFAGLAVRAGIPPIVSIGIMAALLPLEYAVLRYLEKN